MNKGRRMVLPVMVLSLILLPALAAAGYQPGQPHSLGINSLERMKPNGEYQVQVFKEGKWQEAGKLTFDRFFRERTIDLSSYVSGTDPMKIKLEEKGGGAAHIDSVFLGGIAPEEVKGSDSSIALKKLSHKDFDVIDAYGKDIEVIFPAKGKDKNLTLTARVEGERISETPFQFPLKNLFREMNVGSAFYTYKIGSKNESGKPFFKEYSQTGTGHPSGFTYGWVSNDDRNLYVKIDFTPDDTMDGDKDYAKVYVKTEKGLKEFKMSVPENKWGKPDFTYTDKVAYQHKVYDFKIPFSELGIQDAKDGDNLPLAFASYGTSGPSFRANDLAYDPAGNRYLAVYTRLSTTVYGQFLECDGTPIGSEFVIYGDDYAEKNPKVAYDSHNNRFLVVWQSSGDDSNIYGRLVSFGSETPVGGTIDISVADKSQREPAVAYDDVNHQYLVVWQDERNGNDLNIYGQRVDDSGSPTEDNFAICEQGDDQSSPSVAFDHNSGMFLVAWQDGRNINAVPSTDQDIYGHLVYASGSLYAGDDILISNDLFIQDRPQVSNDSTHGRFLVVWGDDFNLDIHGKLINANNGELFSGDIAISGTGSLKSSAEAAYDSTNDRFLVIWQDYNGGGSYSDFNIYGRYVSSGGVPDVSGNFAVADTSDFGYQNPQIAFNSNSGNFLAFFDEIDKSDIHDMAVSLIGPPCTSFANLFVADGGAVSIDSWPKNAAGDIAPATSIRGNPRLALPSGVAVDGSYIYVADPGDASILVFPKDATGNEAPTRIIRGDATTLLGPSGVAVDGSYIYVANTGDASILVFGIGDSGDVAPTRTIKGDATTLSWPYDVSVDGSYIYVAETENNSILVFDKTKTDSDIAPDRTISGDAMHWPLAVAVDASNIYVAFDQDAGIAVFPIGANGEATPTRTISGTNTTLNYPYGIAVDGSYIYVAETDNNSILVFALGDNGDVAPTRTISGTNTTLSGPHGVVVDGSYIYVTNDGDNSILVFALGDNGDVAPTRVIKGLTTLAWPTGVAVDGSNIYVANSGDHSILVFALGDNGDVAPTRVIKGDATTLTWPSGIAVDGSYIYVAETENNSIVVFAIDDDGDVAPTRAIKGGNTEIFYPSGVAVDASYIYVAGPADNSILVFKINDDGDVAPTRRIHGDATTLSGPNSVAVDGSNIYVANTWDPSILVFKINDDGDAAPTRRIMGGATELNQPYGVAVDASNIYVANSEGSSILVFAIDDHDNVAPTRTIKGASTTLHYPLGIAVAKELCPTPGTPSSPSPSDGASDQPADLALSWSAASDTDSYDVYFGTSSNPPYYGNVSGTSYPLSGLSYSTPYYWKVVAKNNCLGSTSGPVWSFTTGALPSGPDLTFVGGAWEALTQTEKPKMYVIRGTLLVTNQGNQSAGRISITFYESSDGSTKGALLGSETVNSLRLGQVKTLRFSYRSPDSLAGKYVIAIIDDEGTVNETNEGNNTASAPIP